MEHVKFCPFCGGREIVNVKIDKEEIANSPESVRTVYTYCCEYCGGLFSVKDCYYPNLTALDEYLDSIDRDSDDKCSCEDTCSPPIEWYEKKNKELERELEKTRYLLDLTVKEGMKRE